MSEPTSELHGPTRLPSGRAEISARGIGVRRTIVGGMARAVTARDRAP
jgi:hypothetical protein